ncbi:MAG: hypothetical protein RLZZ227_1284 [Pseudomonadota bacterium]
MNNNENGKRQGGQSGGPNRNSRQPGSQRDNRGGKSRAPDADERGNAAVHAPETDDDNTGNRSERHDDTEVNGNRI